MRYDVQYEVRLAGSTEVEAENETEAMIKAREEIRESGDEVLFFTVHHVAPQEYDGD